MNSERKLTLIYFVLGIGMGVLSNYLSTLIAVVIAAVLYIASFFASRWLIGTEGKKISWYVLNTLLTFALVWLVTWIFLFNL